MKPIFHDLTKDYIGITFSQVKLIVCSWKKKRFIIFKEKLYSKYEADFPQVYKRGYRNIIFFKIKLLYAVKNNYKFIQ